MADSLCSIAPGLCCSYNPQFLGPFGAPLANISVNIYDAGHSGDDDYLIGSGLTDTSGLLQPAVTLIMGASYDFTTSSDVLAAGSLSAPIPTDLQTVSRPPVFLTLGGVALFTVTDTSVTAYVRAPRVVQVATLQNLSLIRSLLPQGPWNIVATTQVDNLTRYLSLVDPSPILGRGIYYSAFATNTSGKPGILTEPIAFCGGVS